jgi:DNA-binding NarL/FixJ family response regulator
MTSVGERFVMPINGDAERAQVAPKVGPMEPSLLTLRRVERPAYDRRGGGVLTSTNGPRAGPKMQPGILIVDPNSIFRMGMVAYLGSLPGMGPVVGCSSVAEAWQDAQIECAALVMVDLAAGDIATVIGRIHARVGCPVLVTSESWDREGVLEAVVANAIGVVCKDGLTAESLGIQVRAAMHGAGVVPPQLLTSLVAHTGTGARQAVDVHAGLTKRERDVLRLIADGRMTREVATELCYSERTVKTVLRDAVMKLGARSRSQAIAFAVREGLI